MSKQYAEPATYEAKLEKVMARFGVEKYDYDWSRHSCWVEFFYKGQLYRFEHSIENAIVHGVNVRYGSDLFAQVVLSLEDLARMAERGIYDLSIWIAGMKYLPPATEVPDCFKVLHFNEMPTIEVLRRRYHQLAKSAHPDSGGSEEQFILLKKAFDEAREIIEEGNDNA